MQEFVSSCCTAKGVVGVKSLIYAERYMAERPGWSDKLSLG